MPLCKNSIREILERLGSEKRIVLGLDRVRAAAAELGHPERHGHSLLVGGTNGKGTTTLLLSAALRAAGHDVATYLSPHLESPTERFLWNGSPISEEELDSLGLEHERLATDFDLTYFEFLTLLFLVWARRRGARFSVLEVGMGGRLDATNLVDPIASIITNVGLDHEKWLGNTEEAILEEKMGILRAEGLAFSGIDSPELVSRLIRRCEELDCIYYLSRELRLERTKLSWEGQDVTLNGYPFRLTSPSVAAARNAALAFLALRIVFPKIPVTTLQEAFAGVRNPGRLEVVQRSPRVVLSGDHNPHGLETLLQTLRELPTGRVHTVCAFSPEKAYERMVRELEKVSTSLTLTEVPRWQGQMPEGYRELAPFEPDARRALAKAIASAGPDDTVLVTGSLYLVGEARSLWARSGLPSRPWPDSIPVKSPRAAPSPARPPSAAR